MAWDPHTDGPVPMQRRQPIDPETLEDGRCLASSWRSPMPKNTRTYENWFGPGGYNRCIGHEAHRNPLHKDEWGHVFSLDPFHVVYTEEPS